MRLTILSLASVYLFLYASMHSLSVLPGRSESSRETVNTCPFLHKVVKTGFMSFVNFLGAKARWATADWSWPKEWNWYAPANDHFKNKFKNTDRDCMVKHSSQMLTSEEEATTRAGPLGSALYSYVWSLHSSLKNFFYNGHVWLCCSRHPSSPLVPCDSSCGLRLRAVFSVPILKCLYVISSCSFFQV